MNELELKMVDLLVKGREKYGVVSVKAEFEAEGTRLEELLRLMDVARAAQLPVTVKIGGCEAIRDLLEAKQIGCRWIVAPMIESGYAAQKYLEAKNLVYSDFEERQTGFLFNIETITGHANREEILSAACEGRGLSGAVLGRHDFVGSLGQAANTINDQKTTNYVLDVAELCKKHDKEFVVGGGMSVESLDAIKQIATVRLDRFETRKVIFDADKALSSKIEIGLAYAVRFELYWLQNKRDYYLNISNEDSKRITHFEKRIIELESKIQN